MHVVKWMWILKYCVWVEELETKEIGLDSRGTMTVVRESKWISSDVSRLELLCGNRSRDDGIVVCWKDS